MNQIRNYNKQMWTVQNYAIAPNDAYEVTKFEVEEISGTPYVMIIREYKRKDINFSYSECVTIGARGGVKKVYNNII